MDTEREGRVTTEVQAAMVTAAGPGTPGSGVGTQGIAVGLERRARGAFPGSPGDLLRSAGQSIRAEQAHNQSCHHSSYVARTPGRELRPAGRGTAFKGRRRLPERNLPRGLVPEAQRGEVRPRPVLPAASQDLP